MGRVPGGIEDDHPVGCNQVYAQATGFGGDQKQSCSEVKKTPSPQRCSLTQLQGLWHKATTLIVTDF